MVKLVLRNTRHGGQAKYSGNKPGTLGEITVSITIIFKKRPASAGGYAKYSRV